MAEKLIGTEPHQVPSNADLGSMAFVDHSSIGDIRVRSILNFNASNSQHITAGDEGVITLKSLDNGRNQGLYLERYNERRGYYIYPSSGGLGASDTLNFDRNNAGTKATTMALDRDGDATFGGNVKIHNIGTIIRSDGGIERNARQYLDLQNTAGATGSTEGFHAMYHRAYKKINTALGVQHGNGNWYVALATTGGTQYVYYALSVNSAKNLRVLGTWSNFADSVTRTASIQYSTDQGNTWTTGSTGTFGSSAGSTQEVTINLTQPHDHLGTVLVRYTLTNGNNNLIGLNRVYFESIGSSAGISLIPNYIEPSNFTIIQDDSNQSDRPRYHYRAGKVMASNFNNPTQNILTVNSAQVNHHLSVYVRMRHSVYTTNGGSDLSEGMAEYVSGGTNTTSGNLNIVSSTGGNLSAGNLAWSGNTLQVTGVRNSNYDRYYITVEVIEANTVSWTWNI